MDLSIIIPIYNGENFIAECLYSILGQSSTFEYEVIIVDDGSTDKSATICEDFENPKIRLFKNSNNGVSYSRNYGIKYARGKYLMFVDADDKLSQNWTNAIAKSLTSNDDVIYLSSTYNSGRYSKEDLLYSLVGSSKTLLLKHIKSPCSKLYKRQFIIENGILFNSEIINGEDLLFNLDVLHYCKKFSFISESIYSYRCVLTSATHSFNENFVKSNLMFLKELEAKLNDFNNNNFDLHSIVSDSFVNSIYLLVYRISKLSNNEIRHNKLKKICKLPEMSNSFNYYFCNNKNSTERKLIYMLVSNGYYKVALLLMRIRNMIFESKKEGTIWEKI